MPPEIIFAGVAIGGGWQALVAYINLGSYYIFGLPLGYLLGYRANLGVTVKYLNSSRNLNLVIVS
jgi:Na+-driven multidrug efflux pump